jgi:hypothetical protein
LFFIVFVSISIVSCIGIEDKEGMVPEVKYFYINNSSHSVKIRATKTRIFARILDSLIPVGDTIQYWDYVFGDAITGPFGTPAESLSVTMFLYGTENRCLKFSDSCLSPGDIRSNIYYSDMGERRGNISNRCYIITDEHYNKAVPCS